MTVGAVRRQPYGPDEDYAKSNIASNLTFASLPLTLMGNSVTHVLQQDLHPDFDTADIRQDMVAIQKLDHAPVAWRWYEDGYGLESTDTGGVASHNAYVSHHHAPQYFGYLADNPAVYENLQGETQFFTDMAAHALPQGGVFYIRGGYLNQMGLVPYTHPGTRPTRSRPSSRPNRATTTIRPTAIIN